MLTHKSYPERARFELLQRLQRAPHGGVAVREAQAQRSRLAWRRRRRVAVGARLQQVVRQALDPGAQLGLLAQGVVSAALCLERRLRAQPRALHFLESALRIRGALLRLTSGACALSVRCLRRA